MKKRRGNIGKWENRAIRRRYVWVDREWTGVFMVDTSVWPSCGGRSGCTVTVCVCVCGLSLLSSVYCCKWLKIRLASYMKPTVTLFITVYFISLKCLYKFLWSSRTLVWWLQAAVTVLNCISRTGGLCPHSKKWRPQHVKSALSNYFSTVLQDLASLLVVALNIIKSSPIKPNQKSKFK